MKKILNPQIKLYLHIEYTDGGRATSLLNWTIDDFTYFIAHLIGPMTLVYVKETGSYHLYMFEEDWKNSLNLLENS